MHEIRNSLYQFADNHKWPADPKGRSLCPCVLLDFLSGSAIGFFEERGPLPGTVCAWERHSVYVANLPEACPGGGEEFSSPTML